MMGIFPDYNHPHMALWLQGRHEELYASTAGIHLGDPEYWQHQHVLLRSLTDRVKLAEAKALCEYALENIATSEPLSTVFHLWKEFTALLTGDRLDIHAVINFFEAQAYNAASHIYPAALAVDLLSRTLSYGIGFGMLSALKKKDVIELYEKAANEYLRAGFINDGINTLKKLAQTAKNKPCADVAFAKSILHQILNIGLEKEDDLVIGYARLGLADINFEEIHSQTLSEDIFKSALLLFEQAEGCYINGKHLAANAIVTDKLGSILLKYGYEAGVENLREAINEYHTIGYFADEQSLWRQLASWYLMHGDDAAYHDAEEKAVELNNRVQHPLGYQIAELAEIDKAYRHGDLGKAKIIYKAALDKYSNSPFLIQFDTLQANSLAKNGLKAETTELYRSIINRLEFLKESYFLVDAYCNLANKLSEEQPQEAIEYALKANDICDRFEDGTQKILPIQLIITSLIHQQRQSGLTVTITEAIATCLEQCFIILAADATLDGMKKLGEVLQTKGQVYFYAKRLEESKKYYADAEQLFSHHHLNSNLAFLYSQQGLLLVEEARARASVPIYEEAGEVFSKGQILFEHMHLSEEQWRSFYLKAICEYEAGRLEDNKDVASMRWKIAENLFESAYAIIRYLRGKTEHSSGFLHQISLIAFVENKQTVLEQAFYMHYGYTLKYELAVKWLERMKAQALLEAMTKKANGQTSSKETINYSKPWINQEDAYKDISTRILKQIDAADDTLIVQYYCFKDSIIVFGFRMGWGSPVILKLPVDMESLKLFIQLHLRNKNSDILSLIEDGMESHWQQFKILIRPVLEWSKPGETICFIPHGILHHLPLHTLHAENKKYLIERNPVVYNLSLSLLSYLLEYPFHLPESLSINLIFGDTQNNLPFAASEAETVGAVLKTKPYLGNETTKKIFLEQFPHAAIFHFAGHGNLSDEGGGDYFLQFAGNDRLSARELFSVETKADIVVLSGCETGVNEQLAGDELLGLVRGFLYAGTGSLIVSQWKVQDKATALLLKKFYHYAIQKIELRLSKAQALQQAMCDMKDNGYNFYYWGGFQLIGKWE